MPPEQIDWFPFWLSLKVAALATGLSLPVSLWAAYRIARRADRTGSLLDSAVLLLLLLPPTILGYYLLVLVGRDSLLDRLWQAVARQHLIFSWQAAVAAAMLYTIPLMVWWFREAFASVDVRLERAAQSLGASEWRVFRRVSVPLAARGLWAGIVLAFARALGDFAVTLMVASNLPGRTQTLTTAVYEAVQAGRTAQAGALGMAATLLVVALVFLGRRLRSSNRPV